MKLDKKVKKVGIIVGGVVIAVLIVGKTFHIPVISTGVNYVLIPIQKGITFVSDKTTNFFKYFEEIDTLRTENKTLKETNEKLFYENTILSQYEEENKNLKQLLEMKSLYQDYEGIGANVIGKDSSNWYKVITIDKGTKDGVKENSVILASGGLVGHVWEASDLTSASTTPNSAKVLSIIDDRSSVSAEVVRTGDVGIVNGDIELVNEGLCVLEINVESEVIKGDQIVTSHLSSIYPPGIPIGTVEEVVDGKNGLTRYAYVKPYVDFKHLKNVLVINYEQGE
nr:rod shape-determining protein MreC [uncultured Cellulosilyticum sp.]